jgi:Flp pilus assembly protein TadD
MARSRSRTRRAGRVPRWAILLGLAIAVFVAFEGVGGHGFLNYDDDEYVTGNVQVRGGLTLRGFVWAWTTFYAANWHPMTWLSHMTDVSLFGLDPGSHHLTSLVVHIVNTLLLFLLLEGMTGSAWPSAAVAAMFGVHPLHVESVVWIAERKDVLATFWGFAAMLAYTRYAARPTRPRYLAVFALFSLSLLSKPMLVTLPVLLLLLDFWPLRRWRSLPDLAPMVREKLPLLALSAASALVTILAQRAGGALGTLASFPWPARVANACVGYAAYLIEVVWPVGLAVFYPFPEGGPAWWRAGLAAGAVAGATFAAVRLRRRMPYLIAGWSWYMVALLPVIGLVQVGEHARADRYTYVPLVGIFVAVCWGLRELARDRPGGEAAPRAPVRVLGVSAVAVLAVLVVLTRQQVGYWRDSETLFEHALAVTRDNATAHLNLALALFEENRYQDASEHLLEAVRIRPGWEKARNNLGLALLRLGKPAEARPQLEEAVRLDPELPEAHSNLGMALAKLGRVDEAVAEFSRAIELDPAYPEAHYNRGTALALQQRWEEASRDLHRAIELRPDYADAHGNLASVLFRQERFSEALAEMRSARRLGRPPDPAMLKAVLEGVRRGEASTGPRRSGLP